MFQKVGVVNFVYGNIYIDAIEKWAREFFEIVFFLSHGTSADVSGISGIAAWAGVHGSDKHEIAWVCGFAVRSRNGYFFVFQWLTK